MRSDLHYDDYSQAIKYLKLALPEMNRLKIPATPENYAVWYEYTTGKNSALIQKIDTLKNESRVFSQSINDHLYDIFISKRPNLSINKLNIRVKGVINELLSQIKQESDDQGIYSSSLEELSSEVTNIEKIADVEMLITRLLNEAHKRTTENKEFRQQIKTMSKEVEQLDKHLRRVALDANTDALTGIFNRRAFNLKLSQSLANPANNFSLIMIDIDHFKRLNDTYGHLTGDKVLKFVALLIGRNIRGSDYLARFGGEEFVVILPNTQLENALCVANNIRTYLAKQKLYDSTEDKQLGRLTLSMGVASSLDGDTCDKLIGRADQCLYQAKSAGRNKAIEQTRLSHSEILQ